MTGAAAYPRTISLKNVFLFDLDGSVYFGDAPAPGARDFFEYLAENRVEHGFISNDSARSAEQIVKRLAGMGIPAEPERIFHPTSSAGEFIKESFGLLRILVLGSRELERSCISSGHQLVKADANTSDLVLVGLDSDFSYAKLRQSVRHLHFGARFVAANLDSAHPGDGMIPLPETGALVASIREAARVEPIVIGKPEEWLFIRAARHFACPPSRIVIVGDNPETDLAGGRAAGMITVHLNDAPERPSPLADITCRGIRELHRLLRDLEGGSTCPKSH